MNAAAIQKLVLDLPKIELADVPDDHYVFYITTGTPAILTSLRGFSRKDRTCKFGFFYITLNRTPKSYKFQRATAIDCIAARERAGGVVLVGDFSDIENVISKVVWCRERRNTLDQWRRCRFPSWGQLKQMQT